jgi:hypothetical protein
MQFLKAERRINASTGKIKTLAAAASGLHALPKETAA